MGLRKGARGVRTRFPEELSATGVTPNVTERRSTGLRRPFHGEPDETYDPHCRNSYYGR